MILLDLVHNIALLVALAATFQIIESRWHVRRLTSQFLYGLLFGAAGVVGMMTPVHFMPGIIFDGRSIILSVGGFFGGPVVAVVAALICGAYRLWLGGTGAAMGLSVIVESAALGVAFHYWRRRAPRSVSLAQLWGFGLLVHGGMLGLVILLPGGARQAVWQQLGLAIIGFYPVATMLICLLFLDYEKQRHARTAIAESEARFRGLFEQATDGILVADAETKRFILANREIQRMLGYAEAELLQLTVADLHPAADLPAVLQQFERQVRREITLARDIPMRRKDGTVFYADVNTTALRLQERNCLIGFFRDITDRKRAEEQLRKQAALLDSANDAIHVRTLDHTVTYWNTGAERLYGWSETEALGRKIIELADFDQAAFVAAHATLLERGHWSGELKKTGKQGGERVVFCRWTLLRDDQGRPTEVLAIHADITEQKRLEENFLRVQRMEGIGALAGGIAHDLNNILAPILMVGPLLREKVSDPESRDLIDTMEECAQRGSDTIKQLLTFARGKPGVRAPVSVRDLVSGMEKLIRETFPRNIQSRVNSPADLWPILGDNTQIHQAIMNLCVNARDAMPEGGTLTLTAENAILDKSFAAIAPDARPGEHVCVRVSDTGTGIPLEHLDHIFDPFFTTKEIGKGTGLGLATVLGIVRGHGGFVRVNSQVGQGTTFELYLPASPEVKAIVPTGHELPPQGRGELILVVDDESAVRSMVQRTLEKHGYRVIVAAEGNEALALFAAQRGGIKAVITDLMMPGLDGPKLVQSLRQLDARLPILGMTGLAERVDVKGIEGLRLPELLIKPFTGVKLLATLHDMLSRVSR